MSERTTKSALENKNVTLIVDAFSAVCGCPCSLSGTDGELLHVGEGDPDLCRRCRELGLSTPECDSLQMKSAKESSRFGGRYTYTCPIGMGWISVPVYEKSVLSASLSAGPVLLMSYEEALRTVSMLMDEWDRKPEGEIEAFLKSFPVFSASRFSALSVQLLSAASYISDSTRLILEKDTLEAQIEVSSTIRQLRNDGERKKYPIELEHSLMLAVTQGSQSDASRMMNELLGHLIFTAGNDVDYMQARISDLLTLMTRAAIGGGADPETSLSICQRFQKTGINIRSMIDLGIFISKAMKQFTGMVYELSDLKHKRSIYKAISYMRNHISEKMSLKEVASHVGFSASYLSRIFKSEMGMNFNSYLQRERVELAKLLLLRNDLSTPEICQRAGFEDQSYFIKVFRRFEGVTPGEFRHGRNVILPSAPEIYDYAMRGVPPEKKKTEKQERIL